MSLILKLKLFYIATILICVLTFLCVYCIEYILEVDICSICVFERFSYLLVLVFTVQIYMRYFHEVDYTSKSIVAMLRCVIRNNQLISVIMLASVVLSGYHSALEGGWIEKEFLCQHDHFLSDFNNFSKEDLMNNIMSQKSTPCNISPFQILNFSVTELNFGLSIFIYIAYLGVNFYIKEKYFNPYDAHRELLKIR